MDKLKALQSKHADSIGDVRGLGLMIGMEFTKVENGRIVADAAKRDAFIQKAFEKGLLTLACGNSTVRFCPPLVISKSDIDIAYDIISDVVSAL